MDPVIAQITFLVLDIALGAVALGIAKTALRIAQEAKASNTMALQVVSTLEPRLNTLETKLDAILAAQYH